MFGFGKKNQTPATQPQPQQISPEAMAILETLQAQPVGQQMPAQTMAPPDAPQGAAQQPMAPQSMPLQGMGQTQMSGVAPQPGTQAMRGQELLMAAMQAAPSQPMQQQPSQQPFMQPPMQQAMAQQGMAQPQMPMQPQPPGVSGFDLAGMNTPVTKTKRELKKEQAAAKRAEKEKKVKQATEEKTRKKRRKQLSKMRFSRARYLRESNGNLISSIVLWLFLLTIWVGGSLSLVNLYLAPITQANQQTIQEIDQLQRTIRNSQPQIQQALTTRRERESEVQLLASTLQSNEQIRSQLEQFIAQMKAADIVVENEDIQTVDLGSPAITGIQFSANLTTNYLKWLQERNRFLRRQAFGRIPVERITASEESSEITVEVSIILPAAN